MTLHRSRRATLALVVLIVVLLLFRSGAAQAGGSAGSPPLGAWLAPDGMPPPAIVYDAVGRCLSAPHCPDREQLKRLLERYERAFKGQNPPPAYLQGIEERANRIRAAFGFTDKWERIRPSAPVTPEPPAAKQLSLGLIPERKIA